MFLDLTSSSIYGCLSCLEMRGSPLSQFCINDTVRNSYFPLVLHAQAIQTFLTKLCGQYWAKSAKCAVSVTGPHNRIIP